jgi:hypothetical protein
MEEHREMRWRRPEWNERGRLALALVLLASLPWPGTGSKAAQARAGALGSGATSEAGSLAAAGPHAPLAREGALGLGAISGAGTVPAPAARAPLASAVAAQAAEDGPEAETPSAWLEPGQGGVEWSPAGAGTADVTGTVMGPGAAPGVVPAAVPGPAVAAPLVLPLLPPPPPMLPPALPPMPPLARPPFAAAAGPAPEVPVIPEADSVALLAVGLAALGALARWRRRRLVGLGRQCNQSPP